MRQDGQDMTQHRDPVPGKHQTRPAINPGSGSLRAVITVKHTTPTDIGFVKLMQNRFRCQPIVVNEDDEADGYRSLL